MVITSMLCQLIKHEDDGIPSLVPFIADMDSYDFDWYSPNEKVGLKGFLVHWYRIPFFGFDDGLPF